MSIHAGLVDLGARHHLVVGHGGQDQSDVGLAGQTFGKQVHADNRHGDPPFSVIPSGGRALR